MWGGIDAYGWGTTIDGNYMYTKGRIKNTGDKAIRYFKLTAEYLNSKGDVLDTDYTNSTETIRPGNSKVSVKRSPPIKDEDLMLF